MVRAITYRMQERAQGGLGAPTRRRLRALAQELEATGSGKFGPGITLKPGATIVGEWRGSAYSVLVLDDGFEYAGSRYRSLSQIASLITGAHWSGPRFFGLAARRSRGGRP